MKLNKIYVVQKLQENIKVSVNLSYIKNPILHDSELVWEDGMLRVAPIFKSKEAAEKAYPGYEVEEWLEENNERN